MEYAKNIVYDNTRIAVAKILGDGTRRRTQAFSELISHYLFQERFGRPGRGNDKAYASHCASCVLCDKTSAHLDGDPPQIYLSHCKKV